ncbi:MAG TPA: GAF domain-containing protein, partial [Candidatus Acidoferrales bacterium]|nr:GAF domain-containing protein [Candidatus Acidoferrales bacterium]
MSELGQAFAQLRVGTNADQILDRLAQHAGQVSSADRACVLLRAEPSRGWAIMGHTWPEAPRSLERVSIEEGKPLERVVSKRESVWVRSPSRELAEFDRLLAVELGFLGLLPVVTEGVVLGVLVLGWIGRERPSEILHA